jgi:hypothetical protein
MAQQSRSSRDQITVLDLHHAGGSDVRLNGRAFQKACFDGLLHRSCHNPGRLSGNKAAEATSAGRTCRVRQQWYMLSFEGCEDQFTSEKFDRAFSEYDLFRLVEQPGLLLTEFQPANA